MSKVLKPSFRFYETVQQSTGFDSTTLRVPKMPRTLKFQPNINHSKVSHIQTQQVKLLSTEINY